MQSGKTLLVDSVHLEFGQLQVLQNAFITAHTGRVTVVLGRNGSGKSSLFKCIMGGVRPQNIFIRLGEEQKTDCAYIGKRVKYLPQKTFIPANMLLEDAFSIYGVDYDALVEFAEKFRSMRKMQMKELSGGEARIAEVFMILESDAEFCILDEPFLNVTPNYVEKIKELILRQKENKGIIISDHMYESVMGIADDIFLLKDGYTFAIKSRQDLISHGYILR